MHNGSLPSLTVCSKVAAVCASHVGEFKPTGDDMQTVTMRIGVSIARKIVAR